MPRFRARADQEARESRFTPKLLTTYKAFGLPEHLAVKAGTGDGEPTEILLYDEIGYWGITAKDFVLALAKAGAGPLTVRINSPGGDVFDGVAIYNALKGHPAPVTVVVDGLAASAASVIAMAGSSIVMNQASMLMIHNCWGVCVGNRIDMRATADIQEKIDTVMAAIYAGQMQKRGRPSEGVQALMDAETYFTADEAKSVGLADSLVAPVPIPNTSALSIIPKCSIRSEVQPYDPDGDGDNDAQEALTLIQAAQTLLNNAADALTGNDEAEDETETEDTGNVIVPGASLQTDTRANLEPEKPESRLEMMRMRLRLAEVDAL